MLRSQNGDDAVTVFAIIHFNINSHPQQSAINSVWHEKETQKQSSEIKLRKSQIDCALFAVQFCSSKSLLKYDFDNRLWWRFSFDDILQFIWNYSTHKYKKLKTKWSSSLLLNDSSRWMLDVWAVNDFTRIKKNAAHEIKLERGCFNQTNHSEPQPNTN